MKIFIILLIACLSISTECRYISSKRHRNHHRKHKNGLKLKSYNSYAKYVPKSRNLRPRRPQRYLKQEVEKTPYQQDAEFREAWKEFRSTRDPNVDLFAAMNKQLTKNIQKANTERHLSKVDPYMFGFERKLENENDSGLSEADENDNKENDKKDENDNITTDDESFDGMVGRILSRTHAIDDKIDHLLFHNHHDLAGTAAHYTPYGVQILPQQKSEKSVDQKLKMVDYMHNLGGGYNPMLHTILPYYLGQQNAPNSSIPFQQPMRKLRQFGQKRVNRYI